jgi:hypothetical protein
MNAYQFRKVLEIRDEEIRKLSERVVRIRGCSLNRVLEVLERSLARAQAHRMFLLRQFELG